jgi:O-antigen ligase
MTAQTSETKSTGILARWFFGHDDRRTRHFTLACLSTPPIAGSLSSIIVNFGAVGGLLEVCSGAVKLSRDRGMIHLSVAIYSYCAAYLVSFALNPVTSESWHYLLPILTFLLFPFLYSSWCMSRKETVARIAVTASMIACYGALALAVVQFHLYGMRAEGGAGNAIVFATATCLAASVVLAGMFMTDRVSAVPLFGAYLAGSIAILYSGSRITWVALALATAAVLFLYRKNIHVRVSGRVALCGVLAIGAITIVGLETVPSRLDAFVQDWRQLSLDGDYDSSLGRRAGLWEIGMEAARDNPIIGYGPQSTRLLIKEGFRNEIGFEASYSHFHNGFLNAWVETGFLGAISLAVLFVIAARIGMRTLAGPSDPTERFGAVILIVLVTTYIVSGLTGILVGQDILDSMLMTFLVIGAYLSTGTSQLDDKVEMNRVSDQSRPSPPTPNRLPTTENSQP